jgi:signal transduction histidine kinase
LIVDDNADMRDYICRLLQGRYELITAADGAHALAIAHEKKPDLVLSDIMMAGLDGVALLQAIRNDGRLKATPVILLSARAGGEARVEGIEHGADDYLVKPFSARELLARIETHLRLARVRAEMNRELEEQVEERTASLRQAVEQMEEFSYSVSHDLRAPVRAMQSYAEAILEDHAGNLDEEGRYFLNRIAQGASRMDQLIRDVLTYSRVSRREMQLRPVALDRLVRDVIEQYPEFAANRAKITIRGQLPSVIAHEPSLSQVISNLLSNAVKFVKRGDFPEVLVRSEFIDGQVRVWIEDNGVGIKPEYQPRLFAMFERVHPDGGYEGTGIGLAIVRKAVERMGGKAGVESDGVHGSRFWIQLPPG